MQIYPLSAILVMAAEVAAAFGALKVRLFEVGTEVSATTTRAQLIAAEVAYTGYTVGGESVDGLLPPLLNPLGGVSMDIPTVQFAAVAPYTLGAVVGGYWVESAVTPFDVLCIGTFPSPGIPIGAIGQGFPFAATLLFPLAS